MRIFQNPPLLYSICTETLKTIKHTPYNFRKEIRTPAEINVAGERERKPSEASRHSVNFRPISDRLTGFLYPHASFPP